MLNTVPITLGKLSGCLETLYKLGLPAYFAGRRGSAKPLWCARSPARGLELVTLMLSQLKPSEQSVRESTGIGSLRAGYGGGYL